MESRLNKVLALSALAASALACGNKPAPTPEKDTPAPAVTTAAPSASAAATPPPAAKTIPRLVAEKLKPKEGKAERLYAIEGALMIVDGIRVGRIVGDDVEWIGKIPKETLAFGDNVLDAVVGRWPDRVAALYRSGQPRAPQPTYFPLVGKGGHYQVAPGAVGHINGVTRIGESTLLATFDYMDGHQIVTVQGPPLARVKQKKAPAGCAKSQSTSRPLDDDAVPAEAIESTPDGTLVTLGTFCWEGVVGAAEVWDKAGKSRILKLDRWWKKLHYGARLLKGSGDELFAYNGRFDPVLQYRDGAFEALPLLGAPIRHLFTSPSGKLHASDGEVVHRYEGGKWAPIAALPERNDRSQLVLDDQGTLWDQSATRLREGPAVPVPEPCARPFVYLYESAYINGYQKNFTYPATQKALASFPEVASIGLVEFGERDDRHLGIQAASRAQGEALIEHVKATMKDERPRLFCFEPETPRKIEIKRE